MKATNQKVMKKILKSQPQFAAHVAHAAADCNESQLRALFSCAIEEAAPNMDSGDAALLVSWGVRSTLAGTDWSLAWADPAAWVMKQMEA